MKRLTIWEDSWGDSYLYDPCRQKMCCLGMGAVADGATLDQCRGEAFPKNLPPGVAKGFRETMAGAAGHAAALNDEYHLAVTLGSEGRNAKRKQELRDLFKERGITLVFRKGVHPLLRQPKQETTE